MIPHVGHLGAIFAYKLSQVTSCHATDIIRTQNGTILTAPRGHFYWKTRGKIRFFENVRFPFLAPFWRPIWPLWSPLGAILGACWGLMKPSWRLLEPSWGPLGPSWAPFGPSWSLLDASWSLLVAILEPPVAIIRPLGPCGAHRGLMWVPFWSILVWFCLHFGTNLASFLAYSKINTN